MEDNYYSELNASRSKFPLPILVIFAVLLLNVASISRIPHYPFTAHDVLPLHYVLFVFWLIVNYDFENFSKVLLVKINFFVILTALMIVSFVISAFWVNFTGSTSLRSISKLFSYPLIIFLFFLILPRLFYEKEKIFESFMDLWLYFSLFTAIIAFIFMFLGLNGEPKFSNLTLAFFVHTNTTSFVFTFAIPIVIYKYFSGKISFGKFLVYLSLFFLCLLFTYSRAGYMAVFTSILVFTFRKSKKAFFFSIIVLAILVSTVFLGFAFDKGNSSISRIQIMYAAFNLIFNSSGGRLLWGYGVFDGLELFRKEILAYGILRDELDPHNMVLLIGLQFGMILFTLMITSIIFLLVKSTIAKRRITDEGIRNKMDLSSSIILGLLVQNLLEDVIFYPEFFIMPMFLIFLGYLYVSSYYEKANGVLQPLHLSGSRINN